MKIQLRWNGTYADVKIIECGTMIDLGLLDAKERAALCAELQDVIYEISERDELGKNGEVPK
jgi:hypothetical protein